MNSHLEKAKKGPKNEAYTESVKIPDEGPLNVLEFLRNLSKYKDLNALIDDLGRRGFDAPTTSEINVIEEALLNKRRNAEKSLSWEKKSSLSFEDVRKCDEPSRSRSSESRRVESLEKCQVVRSKCKLQGTSSPDGCDDSRKDDDKRRILQEIKYYEGNLNVFEAKDECDTANYPNFRITKTVTFENKDACARLQCIDNWMQTEPDFGGSHCNGMDIIHESKSKEIQFTSNPATGLTTTHTTHTTQTTQSRIPSLEKQCMNEEPVIQSTKVCCECVKNLASTKVLHSERSITRQANLPHIDKATNVDQIPLNDMLRFITNLFFEVLPKELYERMMATSSIKDEEYEVKVRSYDTASKESCNLKDCKTRNAMPKPECPREMSQPDIQPIRSNPDKFSIQRSSIDSATYDWQITMNGRKILIKVNKSVEDLLLSGNIQNVVRVDPDEMSNHQMKRCDSKTGSRKAMFGKPGCSVEDVRPQANERCKTVDPSDTLRGRDVQDRRNTFDCSRRKQSDRCPVPMVTSPGNTKPRRSYCDKNTSCDTGEKTLYWCNVEVPNMLKVSDESDQSKNTNINNRIIRHTRNRSMEYPSKVHQSNLRKGEGEVKGSQRMYNENYLSMCWELDPKNGENRPWRNQSELQTSDERTPYRSRSHVHATKKMVATPRFYYRNNNSSTPVYIIKIDDKGNCSRDRRYQEVTSSSLTSVKVNTNPFDVRQITCRKCIETLKACSIDSPDGQIFDSYQSNKPPLDFCNYSWNAISRKADHAKEMDKDRARPYFHPRYGFYDEEDEQYCLIDDSGYILPDTIKNRKGCDEWASLEAEYDSSDSNPLKSRGIVFEFSRVKKTEDLSNEKITRGTKMDVASETDKSLQTTTSSSKRSEKKERIEKQKSFLYLTLCRASSKVNQKDKNAAKAIGNSVKEPVTRASKSATSCLLSDRNSTSTDSVKSAERILFNSLPHFINTLEPPDEEGKDVKKGSGMKFGFGKWRWWKKKDAPAAPQS
ncbi:UNVERIFIED_CONTAM: hypothetical protein PYX00_007604 [Menopon gallinae]|uniref:Uncharacterized protein n=1 Tax=Menopon gallinae TaxID=328185 RepID=A0AAW2HKK8_9NEOP